MNMKIAISLNPKLAKDVGKVAADRGTTISGLIQDYLMTIASSQKTPETKQRELDALERSFKKLHVKLGPRTWRREDLYERH
jgi:hypothetical protein